MNGATRLLLRNTRASLRRATAPASAAAVVSLVALVVGALAWRLWQLADRDEGYAILAVAAIAVTLVPITTTVAASARLLARTEEDRITIWRLVGMPRGRARRTALIEVLLPVGAGIVTGWVVSLGVVPVIGLIPLGGVRSAPESTGIPPVLSVGIMALLLAVAGVSAAQRFARALSSPLSVRTRERAPRVRVWRLLVAVVVVIGCIVTLQFLSVSWGTVGITAVLAAVILIFMGAWGLVGPWIIRIIANRMLRSYNAPEPLLTARGLLEDPGGAWRQVAPLALMSFLVVPAGSVLGFLDAVGGGPTVLSDLQRVFFADIRTVVLVATLAAFVLVAASIVLSQLAAIAERHDLWIALVRLGAPAELLLAVRRKHIMAPLAVAVAGPALLAGLMLFPLAAVAAATAPLFAVATAGSLALGVLVVRLAASTTDRALRRVVGAETSRAARRIQPVGGGR